MFKLGINSKDLFTNTRMHIIYREYVLNEFLNYDTSLRQRFFWRVLVQL